MCLMTFHTIFVNQNCVSSLAICACFLESQCDVWAQVLYQNHFYSKKPSAQKHNILFYFIFLIQKGKMIEKKQKSLKV